ncbi:hypothetical protein BB561_002738 [Smittium simulii]|uniref:Histone deacetylase domain-containing protein n=1 Tax=Smittium simulii TaxID=133385 RepID=A0A2T9YPA8_9FUNG|nr:hypothetical protein BB561_002738 [Smittium simulii]
MVSRNQRVAYFYDPDVGNFHYSPGHPMKPHRIRMTHSLVMSYELYKHMSTYRAAPATKREMTQFHTDDYVEFLDKVIPDNSHLYQKELAKYNLEDDCPVFDGMFDFFSLSAGSSMEGAARLNRGFSDICINWSGGLHHAKKSEANGVEEAFYTTDRVMSCSFHKYGEFFPGTGDLRDIGEGKGKYYSVNFPLKENINDQNYRDIFKPVIESIVEWYQPGAIVLQCGADSLAGDKIGCFNLSSEGHASCVSYVKSLGLPLLVLGGGGYSIRNVARAWAYETGILVGAEMQQTLPINDYIDYYGPDYTLNIPARNVDDSNSFEYLERIKNQVIQNLERTKFAPSVQMQSVPLTPLIERDLDMEKDEDEDTEANKDVRMTEGMVDSQIVNVNELYEYDSMGKTGNMNRDSSNKLINENEFRNIITPEPQDIIKTEIVVSNNQNIPFGTDLYKPKVLEAGKNDFTENSKDFDIESIESNKPISENSEELDKQKEENKIPENKDIEISDECKNDSSRLDIDTKSPIKNALCAENTLKHTINSDSMDIETVIGDSTEQIMPSSNDKDNITENIDLLAPENNIIENKDLLAPENNIIENKTLLAPENNIIENKTLLAPENNIIENKTLLAPENNIIENKDLLAPENNMIENKDLLAPENNIIENKNSNEVKITPLFSDVKDIDVNMDDDKKQSQQEDHSIAECTDNNRPYLEFLNAEQDKEKIDTENFEPNKQINDESQASKPDNLKEQKVIENEFEQPVDDQLESGEISQDTNDMDFDSTDSP